MIRFNRFRKLPLGIVCLCAVVGIASAAGPTLADGDGTCEPELTAVFLVEGIYPGTSLELTLLHVQEVADVPNPSHEEILQNIAAAYADDPLGPSYNHQALDVVGNFQLFFAAPMDFGAVTVIDIRDGAVAFAGQQIWMGMGDVVFPAGSSHEWIWEMGFPAAEPEVINIINNSAWSDEYFGNQSYYLQTALDHIRQTDVMRSFGSCAPYQVTAYLHTPTVGATDPNEGHAAPPWGPGPIDTQGLTMSMVKSFYR